MIVRGACLCGAVAFEARLPAAKFVTCYCSRCRKATGSAAAANLYVAPDALRWTRGAAAVARYDHEAARSFATAFCRTCGSPLPHATRSGREVVIPAGSLDDDPHAKPSGSAHWESRAAWVPATPEIPTAE